MSLYAITNKILKHVLFTDIPLSENPTYHSTQPSFSKTNSQLQQEDLSVDFGIILNQFHMYSISTPMP